MQASTSSSSSSSLPTPMKKRSNNFDNEQAIKKSKVEPDALLLQTFDKKTLQSVLTNDNYKPTVVKSRIADLEVKFLRNNFYLKLNNGQDMECFVCSNGALTIFGFHSNDIEVINRLSTFLVARLEGDKEYHVTLMQDGNNAYFFQPDRLTSYFNKDGQSIPALPPYAFTGRVRLRIIGLTLYKKDGKMCAKPIIHLDQVKVVHTASSDEEKQGEVKCVL